MQEKLQAPEASGCSAWAVGTEVAGRGKTIFLSTSASTSSDIVQIKAHEQPTFNFQVVGIGNSPVGLRFHVFLLFTDPEGHSEFATTD